MDKIAGLKEILELDPKNSFARYGVAMELAGRGDTAEAVQEFDTLLANDPDYTADTSWPRRPWPRQAERPRQWPPENRHSQRRTQRQPPCRQRDAGHARRAGPVDSRVCGSGI